LKRKLSGFFDAILLRIWARLYRWQPPTKWPTPKNYDAKKKRIKVADSWTWTILRSNGLLKTLSAKELRETVLRERVRFFTIVDKQKKA
jgi:hypothetical protein